MLVKLATLQCDGCGRWSHPAGFSTAQLAREHAKKLGWTLGKEEHCAKCVRRAQER